MRREEGERIVRRGGRGRREERVVGRLGGGEGEKERVRKVSGEERTREAAASEIAATLAMPTVGLNCCEGLESCEELW